MTRSEMREHVFKLIFRVPFHDKNELREQIDYYFDGLTDVNEKDYEYIKNKALLVCELSDELDEKINSVSEGWPVDRIGKVFSGKVKGILCGLQSMRCFMMMIFLLM